MMSGNALAGHDSEERIWDQMMEYEPGCLAKSLAGHDKGRFYVIIEADGEYVSLADGNTRTLLRPKRKKKKHVQLQRPQDEALKKKLAGQEAVRDEEIKRFLKCQMELLKQGGNEKSCLRQM